MSNICSFYEDKVVFITGSTGLVGTCLVEKILRCLPIRKLILIIRPKRGKSTEERIKQYQDEIVFSRIDKTVFDTKVAWVYGDLTLDNLGLSMNDLLMLESSVNVIFHVAATIKFNEPLATAIRINLKGTKTMLDIAKDCQYLESFIYVSTAYSNFGNKLVEEKLYPQKYTPEFILNMVQSLDDTTINKLSSTMLDLYPNTYTFSKGISEILVEKYAKSYPIAVFRPASIIPSLEDPFPGWINTRSVPNNMVVDTARGNLRVIRASSRELNPVPVDMCANAMLAIAWETFRNKSSTIKFYNYIANNLTVKDYVTYSLKHIQDTPLDNTAYYPFFFTVYPAIQYKILDFLLHTIPAIILDTPSLILQRKLSMMTKKQKMKENMDLLSDFLIRLDWIFKTDNVETLWSQLSETDQKLFNFNLQCINWEEYLPQAFIGLKKYYLKQKMDVQSTNEAKKRYNRLRNIHMLIKYGLLPMFVMKLLSKM